MGLLSAAAAVARSKLSALSSRIVSSGATPARFLKPNNKRMLMVERVHKETRDYSVISTENDSLKMVRNNLPNLSFLRTVNHETADYHIADSCNTWILLCCERGDPQVSWQFLWDPTTAETKPIPPSLVAPGPLPDPLNSWIHRANGYGQVIDHQIRYGLGFDPVSGDYKVVRTHVLDYDTRKEARAEVFSFRTGYWKRIQQPFFPRRQYYRNASVHINGAHYFLAREDHGYVVESFDFVNDRYFPYLNFIPVSDIADYISTNVVLAEFHGSLACVLFDFKHKDTLGWKPSFEIWVWNGSRWSHESTHYPTPPGIFPLYSVVGLYENDKVLLWNTHVDLLYYNCVTRDMEYLDIGIHDNDSSICVFPYIQSSTPQFDGLK